MRKAIRADEVVGKVIEKIVVLDDCGVSVLFNDNTAFAVTCDAGFNNVSFETVLHPTLCSPSLELATADEVNREHERQRRSEAAKAGAAAKAKRREQYERLRAEFEPRSTKCKT